MRRPWCPRDQQLRVTFDGREAVGIAAAADVVLTLRRGGLAEDVAPDFVHLNVVDLHAFDLLRHEHFAALANHHQQVGNRLQVGIGETGNGTEAHSLAQHFDNLSGAVDADLHAAERGG